jgi:hypothetical protein
MIVIRRFWCANEHVTKSLVIDVRTSDKVREYQAMANAEGFAERKFKGPVAHVIAVKRNDTKPNYTIGPSR